jgi:hypothetical protein
MFARVLLGCVALGALALASLAEEPKETKLKPTTAFRGSHSAILEEQFVIVTEEAEWKELWKKHRGDGRDQRSTETVQELTIDFDTHYLVAGFGGHHSSLIVTPFARGDAVLIRFSAHGSQFRPQPPELDKRPEFVKAKEQAGGDYCFVVLPKPAKTVIIEKDVREQLDHSPLWKEQKRFPAPHDKK